MLYALKVFECEAMLRELNEPVAGETLASSDPNHPSNRGVAGRPARAGDDGPTGAE
jgi:hypothetical protein